MSASPDLSVIIPIYNAERTLERAVKSIFQQVGVQFEIILIDNNSADGSLGIIRRLTNEYPSIVSFASETKQGPAAARNAGLALAKADLIQFLDADDYLLPGKFIRQLNLMKDPAIGWITGVSYVVVQGVKTKKFVLEDDPWKGLALCRGLGDTNANMFRKKSILEAGGFDEDRLIGQDYHLYFKLLKLGVPFAVDSNPSACYVQHSGYRGVGRGRKERFMNRIDHTVSVYNYLAAKRPDYLEQERKFYITALLSGIRMFITGEPQRGHEIYTRIFPGGVDWDEVDYGYLPTYGALYRIFGFVRLEQMRSYLRRFKYYFTQRD